jgi:hypothetical protein
MYRHFRGPPLDKPQRGADAAGFCYDRSLRQISYDRNS